MILRMLRRIAERHPYYHLGPHGSYMHRFWLFGRGTERDLDDRQDPPVLCNPPAAGRIRNWIAKRVAIRLHHILRSDAGRDLHDHPAWNISIVLAGGYYELMPIRNWREISHYSHLRSVMRECGFRYDHIREPVRIKWRGPGSIVIRRATSRHTLMLPKGKSTWSIFIIGKKSNEWGFYTALGKVPWRMYEVHA